jgi:hypothetical protein
LKGELLDQRSFGKRFRRSEPRVEKRKDSACLFINKKNNVKLPKFFSIFYGIKNSPSIGKLF